MYKLFAKYGLILAFVIALIFTLIFLVPVLSGLPAGFNELPPEDQVATDVFDVGLKAAIVLIIASVAILILGSLYSIVKNPKSALKGLLGIAVLLVLIFVLYSTTGAESNARVLAAMEEFNVTQNMTRIFSAFLKGSFILAGIALVLMLLGEIRSLLQ